MTITIKYDICDYTTIGQNGDVRGTPPFVIEILSSSATSKDLLLKACKNHSAGVEEYRIMDPENRQVTVYNSCNPGSSARFWSYEEKE